VTKAGFETAIRAFLRRRPFRPCAIELLSGTVLHVTHPEAIRVRDGIAHHVIAEDPERNFVFDHASVSMVYDEETDEQRGQ